MNLIIPIAGKSSRFPNLKPKWMLTHPMSGHFMVFEAIKGLNLDLFDNIYFIALKEHELIYNFSYGLKKQFEILGKSIKIIYLDTPTKSQSETVYNGILQEKIEGSIFIKDSDNYFEANIIAGNVLCFYDLNDCDKINAKNKSYISLDEKKFITNIVEKKIISSTFSVGGYGFESSACFCRSYEKICNFPGECFISNVIYQLLLDGNKFSAISTKNFEDWGTIKDWNEYKKTFKTFFIDLDGTLVKNSSAYLPPYIGESSPIFENINLIKSMYNNKRTKIIITTSRPEAYRTQTLEELNKFNIPFDTLIMGLPHSQRIIINDYAPSNPFPTASAININRNSDQLKDIISEI